MIIFIESDEEGKLICMNECVDPTSNGGAFIEFIKQYAENIQVYALVYFFWFLPN